MFVNFVAFTAIRMHSKCCVVNFFFFRKCASVLLSNPFTNRIEIQWNYDISICMRPPWLSSHSHEMLDVLAASQFWCYFWTFVSVTFYEPWNWSEFYILFNLLRPINFPLFYSITFFFLVERRMNTLVFYSTFHLPTLLDSVSPCKWYGLTEAQLCLWSM